MPMTTRSAFFRFGIGMHVWTKVPRGSDMLETLGHTQQPNRISEPSVNLEGLNELKAISSSLKQTKRGAGELLNSQD